MKINFGPVLGFALFGVLAGIALFSYEGTPSIAVNEQPATEPAVETPAWMQDEDAIAAAEAEYDRKQLKAREAELVSQVKALQGELDSVRKELGTY